MFLENLFFEIGDVLESDLIEPDMPILPGDIELAEVPLDLRKLYTLMVLSEAEAAQKFRGPSVLEAASGRFEGPVSERLTYKAATLRNLFFLGLYEVACPNYDWPFRNLGVRKGWKAVRQR